MIVYNVARQWFEQKADADAFRRKAGLKPASLRTIRLEGREDAVALLNALCGPSIATAEAFQPAGNAGEAPLPRVYPDVVVPDCVPAFLLKDGQRRV